MTYKQIATVSLFGLAACSVALANGAGKSGSRLVEALELDETQAAAVQEIFSSQREQLQTQLEAVLTPEQLEEFNAMREESRKGNRGRRGRGSDSDV